MDFQLSLESETVASLQPEDPLAVTPETPVSVGIGLLGAQRSGAVLVCDRDDTLIGIFTERDALRLMADAAAGGQRRLLTTTVGEVMSTGVTSATTETTVGEAIRVMDAGGYRHLPVVEHAGKPAGAVSVHDIVHYLVGHFPDTVYNLPPKANPAAGEREGA